MLAAVRPAQWGIDLLVLAPLVFAGRLVDLPSARLAGTVLLAFGLMSAGASLLDAWRAGRDAVLLGTAAAFAALGLAVAGTVALRAPAPPAHGLGSVDVLSWCLAYVVLSILDVLFFARIAIADVLAATGRVALRPLAGAAVLQLTPLPGMVGLAAALGLYLAFARRRMELAARPAAGERHVAIGALRMFDLGVDAGAALLVIGWVIHALDPDTAALVGSRDLAWTAPLVGWIAWRHRGHVRRGAVPRASGKRFVTDDPVALLLADRMSVAALLIWFAAILQVVYRPF